MRILLLLVALLPLTAVAQPPPCSGCDCPPEPEYKLVYTRQPANRTPAPPADDASNWEVSPDTGDLNKSNETQVVLDDLAGNIFVAHSCINSPEICAPQEASVSPNGKRIIYSVLRAPTISLVKIWGGPWTTDLYQMQATTAELWLFDIETMTKQRLTTGHMDRQATWRDNETIEFASDRAGFYPASACHGNDYGGHKAMQIHRARISGTDLVDIRNLTPHENLAANPLVTTDGDTLFSSWQGMCHPRFPRPGTPANEWWLARMDANGGQGEGLGFLLNVHNSPYLKKAQWLGDWTPRTDQVHELLSLRVVAELRKGVFAITSYYRGNSTGAMGLLVEFIKSMWEGASKLDSYLYRYSGSSVLGSAKYLNHEARVITPYGTATDATDVLRHKDGRAAGRAGYPAPWPIGWLGLGEESFLFTHGDGWGYKAIPPEHATRAFMGGMSPWHKSIRVAKKRMVENPFDPNQSITIACADEAWQCFDAKAIAEYSAFYPGFDMPAKQAPYPSGLPQLRIVDSRLSEFAGTASAGSVFPASYTQFCIDAIKLPRAPAPGGQTGYAKLATNCMIPELDGSLALDVLPDVPFFHYAINAQGQVIAESPALDSMREGEIRTCHGCHDGHSKERVEQIGESASARFERTTAGMNIKKGVYDATGTKR